MNERLIILSESEIRTALRTFLDCSIKKELEDNIAEALLLYSSPGRINKYDTKIAGVSTTIKKVANVPLGFIKDQLLYSLTDEIAKEVILLKKDNEDTSEYIIECAFRFVENKKGFEVVDTEEKVDV